MKFTATQLVFLMTKMEITDDFIAEAEVFKAPKSTKKTVIPDNEKCSKIKKNGSQCVYRAKCDGLCGRHKIAPSDVIVDSNSD
jgi:hypothetical protein